MGQIQSSTGLITGINISDTVNQLMSIAAQPRDRLQNRVKALQSQQVAINELTALVIGVQLQSTRLGSSSALKSSNVSSSKNDVASASVIGTPPSGTYSIQSVQVSQTSTASSNTLTSSDSALSNGDFIVRTGGFVDGSTNLDDIRGGSGVHRGKIKITDRSGNSATVDLRFASTIDDVINAINGASGIKVSAKTNGDRISLSDLTGQTTSNLAVSDIGEGRTASDLGLGGVSVASSTATGDDLAFITSSTRLTSLRDGRGIAFGTGSDLSITLKDGSTLSVDANSSSPPTTVGQLITAINAVDSSKLEARIQSSGDGIELIDKTSGSSSFVATGKIADQLGWTGTSGTSGTIAGNRIQDSLSGPLLSSLNAGVGVGTPGSISITNRTGTTTQVNLAGSSSLRDVVDRINASAAGVTASFNRDRTGIQLQDVTGSTSSNLIVANGDSANSATQLKIAANTSSNVIDSGALNLQFISETTSLKSLNQGRGVRTGTFTISNAAGQSATINLASLSAKTIGDVAAAINASNLDVQAKLNDTGDGISIIDSSTGTGTLTISDSKGGSAALDLGIRGTGKSVTIDGNSRQQIDGNQTFKLSLSDNESLSKFVDDVNSSNGPVTASLLTSGPSSVRVLFSSRTSGEAGRVVINGSAVGLDVTSTSSGRDAVIAISPTADSGGTLVHSSSNTFDGAISGLSIRVSNASTDPVTLTVSNDRTTIEKNLQLFVDQYNKVRDKIDAQTTYDPASGSTGILFGSNEVLRTEQSLTRLFSQRTFDTGKIQSLDQLGISLGENGKLAFDKTKLEKVLDTNADDVYSYFTKETTGFSARAKKTIDTLTAAKNSLLVNRTQALQRQVDDQNGRVTTLTNQLDKQRTRLLNQFYNLESQIAKIKSNLSSVSSLSTTTR